MKYKIKITYTGVERPVVVEPAPIAATYKPNNSYTETPAYAGTAYDTRVKGFGEIEVKEPYASTSFPLSVPFAQFKMAVVGDNNVVEFETDDYKEMMYYKQAGADLADQGFTVEVEE